MHARPWPASALSLSRVHSLIQGAGVTVGVVDAGVPTNISALAGRITASGDAGQDCVGHGTFAVGLVAGGLVALVAAAAITPLGRARPGAGAGPSETRGESRPADSPRVADGTGPATDGLHLNDRDGGIEAADAAAPERAPDS